MKKLIVISVFTWVAMFSDSFALENCGNCKFRYNLKMAVLNYNVGTLYDMCDNVYIEGDSMWRDCYDDKYYAYLQVKQEIESEFWQCMNECSISYA